MIGYEPILEKMIIVSGQDFSHVFAPGEGETFPNSTDVTLKIYERDDGDQLGAWPAVSVTSTAAQVQITAEDLDPIPDGAVFRVYVTYPTDQALCWYRGRVWRRN